MRILALGLFGLAVYLKFDAVARLPFWKTVRHPGEWIASRWHPEAAPAGPVSLTLAWEPDSSSVRADCRTADSLCLAPGFPLGAEAAGQIRAVLARAEAQWQARAQEGFAATFARDGIPAAGETRWELLRLDLGGPRPLSLAKDRDRPDAAFCANGRCLDEPRPRAPLPAFRSARAEALAPDTPNTGLPVPPSPAAAFQAGHSSCVLPVLRGRVVAVPPPGDTLGWFKLHHGGNLFSYYRGLARIGASVRPGALVESGDTLGWVSGDSGTLELRIESGGTALDPLAFLGVPAGPSEGIHVR